MSKRQYWTMNDHGMSYSPLAWIHIIGGSDRDISDHSGYLFIGKPKRVSNCLLLYCTAVVLKLVHAVSPVFTHQPVALSPCSYDYSIMKWSSNYRNASMVGCQSLLMIDLSSTSSYI